MSLRRFLLLLVAPFLLASALGACSASRPAATPVQSDAALPPRAPVMPAAPGPLPDALTEPLPVDPNVRTGVLPNGVRYYIRHNSEPRDRAELRLAIDAGTALEDPDQHGVAHFVEHMLFNGTEHFPKQDLVNFLERTGMKFGADVNAYTALDETVYQLTIPTDSADIVNKSFEVLEDWATRATLSPEEIDKERGVIIEEWRARRENVQGRVLEQRYPFLLQGSLYADQVFAGTPDVIQNLSYDALRRFYDTWYRPELMAVVAVGDFDVDQYEQRIKEHFSDLADPDTSRLRPDLAVPARSTPSYLVIADEEYPYTTVEVNYIRPAEQDSTVAQYRKHLVDGLANGMLNQRYADITHQAGPPFIGASVHSYDIVRPAEVYGLFAQVQEDSILTGLEALITEAARVRRYGFTTTELARQKSDYLRAYEKAYAEREKTNSAAYADEYVSNFLEAEPIPGIAYEYELVQKLLPQITVQDVNRRANQLLTDSNRAVIVTMPEKEGLAKPTAEQLAAVFQRVEQKEIELYVDTVTDQPLVSDIPAPAAITSTRTTPELDVTEITLANGVKVVLKPTDFKQDEVRFSAFSPGGSSLVSDQQAFEAEMAPDIVTQSGVGAFTRTELDKLLAGKVVSVSPYIGELEEGLSGSASPQDLTTLFQLIHLYFTAPRADSTALVNLQDQYRAYLANRSNNPSAAFQDSLSAALYGKDPRRQVPTIQTVNDLNLQHALDIYRTRFADAGDFTFIFVGNFDTDSLTALAQTYLGTLPATPRTENWRDVYPEPPNRIVEKTAHKGMAPQSQVALVYSGPFQFDREDRHAIRTMSDVLSIMLREQLREEMGGVYGVGVQPVTQAKPDSSYRFIINFTTDPNRVDELVQATFGVLDSLKTYGPSADDMAKVKEQQRRERETQIRTNAFWLGVLNFYYDQSTENMLDILHYNDLIEGIAPAQVQSAAKKYLDMNRYAKVVLYPEDFQQ